MFTLCLCFICRWFGVRFDGYWWLPLPILQNTAILLFAEYIDAATTIAAQSGGGGGGATSGWGRDKDEDELSWAHRCAIMANRLCRPRKKQGYGR